MLHELAHMWFGDSVRRTSGATCGSARAMPAGTSSSTPRSRGSSPTTPSAIPTNGYDTLEELMRAVYAHSDQWRHDAGPVARPTSADTLFSLNVYHGGALVLYALRQVVGAATFDRIQRAWVARYRGRSASTADFIALASQVARRDLSASCAPGCTATTTPPMPGHPDWKVDPVQELSRRRGVSGGPAQAALRLATPSSTARRPPPAGSSAPRAPRPRSASPRRAAPAAASPSSPRTPAAAAPAPG